MSTIATLDAAAGLEPSGCAILHNVSWEFYECFLQEFDERRIPHSFVSGELRIMAPSPRHESTKKWFAQLVETLTDELELPRRSLGSMTIKLDLDEKGAESDECYLIANAPALIGRVDYDLKTDPPPDLVIEIDVTSPSLNRLPVYAAFGVPEVWVYDGKSLRVGLLRDDGTYAVSETSRSFPTLPLQDFAGWINKAWETDETTWIRNFRQWVREVVR